RRFSDLSSGPTTPGPKGPSQDVIAAVVDMKQRNPIWGCPRIAQQITECPIIKSSPRWTFRRLTPHDWPPSGTVEALSKLWISTKNPTSRFKILDSRAGWRQRVRSHGEVAAEGRVCHRRGRQNIVAGRLHSDADPVHEVGEPPLHLRRVKATVVDVADGARHEQAVGAIRRRTTR